MLPPFQSFLDEHKEAVYRYLLVRVGRQEVDDCFQETFTSALRAYDQLPDEANLRAWVLTIAEHKSIDLYRAKARAPLLQEQLHDDARIDEMSEPEPELWKAVRKLPAKQRAAVLYRFVADLAYSDIGRIIDSSEESARQNVRMGLKKLREVWTE